MKISVSGTTTVRMLMLAGTLMAMSLSTLPASAQTILTGNEGIGFGVMDVLRDGVQGYDSASETLVVGASAFLDGGDPNDFRVFIQNRAATYGSYDPVADRHYWHHTISIGPNIPPAVDTPFVEHYRSEHIRFRPVVAELYAIAPAMGSGFIGRATDTLIDGRLYGFSYGAGEPVSASSFGTQLTPSGLQALGEGHGKSTPAIRSTIDDYLSRMASLSFPISAETSPRICVPLIDAPEEIQQTDAFSNVVKKANIQYGTYVTTHKSCEGGTTAACALKQGMCVRESDYGNPAYYKLCIDTLRSTLTDHTIGEIQNIEIEFTGSADTALSSQVALTGEMALVDLEFDDLEIKWSPAPGICATLPPLRPSTPLNLEEMARFPALEEWRTCNALEVNIDKTCTDCTPIDYPSTGADSFITLLEIDSADPEKMTAADNGAGSLGFSGIEYTTEIEACGESYWKNGLGFSTDISDQIIPLMDSTLGVLHSDVNHAWVGDNLDFEYTDTVDDLLQPLEIGTTTIEPDSISLIQQFDECNELLNAGLACNYNTQLTDDKSASVTGWVKSPTGVNGVPLFSSDAKIPGTNADFDASALITTNLLNQHVEARVSDKLTFSFVPTYGQLSLNPPSGRAETDKVSPLTANDLINLAPGFASYGNDTVTITISPTQLKPFVWMHPDLLPAETTLTAQIPQLAFSVRVNNIAVMRGYFSLNDEQMTTELRPDLDQLVEISTDNYRTSTIAYQSTIPGCPITGWLETSSCEKGVAGGLAAMIMPEVASRFDSIFDGVVAAQAFHQQSDFAESIVLTQLATYNQNNTVALYGSFEPGCAAVNYPIPRNQWHMISLPCQPPAAAGSVSAIFGDDIEGTYGTTWQMFELLPNGNYDPLTENSLLQPGTGYWIINNSITDATLDMPAGSTATAIIDSSGCVTNAGCFVHSLNTRAANTAWTMSGNPFDRTIALALARVATNSATQCHAPEVCDLNTANTLSMVSNLAFRYNGSRYDLLTQHDSLSVWHAAWWAAYAGATGLKPKLMLAIQ